MKKKIFLWTSVASMIFGGLFFDTNSVPNFSNNSKLSDVEALTSCELPDGYSPNGHCVSNDRNEHFCSNSSGYLDCYQ